MKKEHFWTTKEKWTDWFKKKNTKTFYICTLNETIFETDYSISKGPKKNDTKDTHTSIMHTYKINRRKEKRSYFLI